MHKVLQTIVDKGNGNCLQAAVASLFELKLDEVPHFLEYKNKWFTELIKFYKNQGYQHGIFSTNHPHRELPTATPTKEILEYDGGHKGIFMATVMSQTFENVTHAVLVDVNLNIVHDPNPNQKALKLKPEDVMSVDVMKRGWCVNEHGVLIKDCY